MKFGKLLAKVLEDPDEAELFLHYKQLKRKLHCISRPPEGETWYLSDLSEDEFIRMLNEDLDHFNQSFIEKEEEFIIRYQILEDETPRSLTALIDLHGEMVLLLHWCMLNSAAVVKILKKHDKHTGLLLRTPFLQRIKHQPFCCTANIVIRVIDKH